MEGKQFFIKPCPCCGSTAEITHSPAWGGYLSAMVAVRCLNPKCGLRMDKRGANAYEAAERAVNAWNQREAEAQYTGKNIMVPLDSLRNEIWRVVTCVCEYKQFEGDGAKFIRKCNHPKNSEFLAYGDCNAEKCPLLTRYREVGGVKDV